MSELKVGDRVRIPRGEWHSWGGHTGKVVSTTAGSPWPVTVRIESVTRRPMVSRLGWGGAAWRVPLGFVVDFTPDELVKV